MQLYFCFNLLFFRPRCDSQHHVGKLYHPFTSLRCSVGHTKITQIISSLQCSTLILAQCSTLSCLPNVHNSNSDDYNSNSDDHVIIAIIIMIVMNDYGDDRYANMFNEDAMASECVASTSNPPDWLYVTDITFRNVSATVLPGTIAG
jgi:hypothetical protein